MAGYDPVARLLAQNAVTAAQQALALATALAMGTWEYVNSDKLAKSGDDLSVDTSAGSVTITLPESGATVTLRDHAGTWADNPVLINGNGELILGSSTFLLDQSGFVVRFFNVAGEWRYEQSYLYGSYPMTSLSGTGASLPATSTPLNVTINNALANMVGPFAPQLAREIRLTLNATVAATGTVQVLRSIDGGVTKLPVTKDSVVVGNYVFAAANGVIVNEVILTETEAAATYYLAITLTAGSVNVRLAQ